MEKNTALETILIQVIEMARFLLVHISHIARKKV